MRPIARTAQALAAICGLTLILSAPVQGATAQEQMKTMDALQAKHDAYVKQLKAMDAPALAARLEVDSLKGREPFNSLAYSELLSRGPAAAESLQRAMVKPDHTSLLGLLALRKLDPRRYAEVPQSFRVAVLADSLGTAKLFNTWGIPGQYGTDAAAAFAAEGDAGVRALMVLLRDTRPAPVWGSEGAAVSLLYGFRVCDYAWWIIREARGEKGDVAQSPAARDAMIAAMLKGGKAQ